MISVWHLFCFQLLLAACGYRLLPAPGCSWLLPVALGSWPPSCSRLPAPGLPCCCQQVPAQHTLPSGGSGCVLGVLGVFEALEAFDVRLMFDVFEVVDVFVVCEV